MTKRLLLVTFLALAGCRAGGPGSPARTVAGFFSKYENRAGFHTTEWSADLLQRLALVKVGKLLGGSDLTNAITGIRSAKLISFVPTSGAAQDLARQGLLDEVNGIINNQRYTPLSTGSALGSAATFTYSVKGSGDNVSEVLATGQMPNQANSFVLVDVTGSFTKNQVIALSKVLPELVSQTAGR